VTKHGDDPSRRDLQEEGEGPKKEVLELSGRVQTLEGRQTDAEGKARPSLEIKM